MTRIFRHGILKVGSIGHVQSAIEQRADLSAFKEKPTPVVLLGVFAIVMSFVVGWPAVAALGLLSLKLHNPWIVAVGGPVTYGLSHLVFLLGMYLSGAKYTVVFFRWLTRITMERLLAWAEHHPSQEK